MAKLSEIKTIVKAKGAGSTFYGNVNADPVYISRGIREVFFVNEEGVQKVINAVGAFQGSDYGSAPEYGKTNTRPGHEYGRYDISGLEAGADEDAGVWIHRAGDSILVYFSFER